MLPGMKLLLDSLWRAAAYCLMPRVIWLTLLPLVLCALITGVLAYFYWEPAVAAVQQQLQTWGWTQTALGWLDTVGAGGLRALLAPLIVVLLVVPLVVILCLLAVAQLMVPTFTRLVQTRRFPSLLAQGHEPWVFSAGRSLGWTLVALLVLGMSLPLWLVPPLGLVLPPLIWGWLGYRVMAADALAEHATRDERRAILREHRWPLWAIGIISGYLGAAPSLIFAGGALAFVLAPAFVIGAVWLYTLVFAFSALWFAHYTLAALARRRQPVAGAQDVLDADARLLGDHPAADPASHPAPGHAPDPAAGATTADAAARYSAPAGVPTPPPALPPAV